MSGITLNIAASGLDAAQTAMDTIAQNLANTNTPGYVSESATLVAAPGGSIPGVGGGVRATSISQASDGLLAANAQQASGALAQSTALQQVLQQAQLAFQEPSSSGLAADLSNFWQSWDQIAQNPTDPAARLDVVDGAQGLVNDFQQASSQLTTTSKEAASQLSTVVGKTNNLLSQVANLNQQIVVTKSGGGSANSLIDQRNQAMGQLAQSIGAVAVPGSDGSIEVRVGGVTLVQGNWSDSLQVSTSGGQTQLVDQATQNQLSATAGTAAGLIAGINQYLPSFQAKLDSAASTLASTVNNQLANGQTATGSAGQPLFTGTTAATLGLNNAIVSNPQLIAAASSTSTAPANDGSNAQAMADLWNSPTGPDVAYRALVQNVGDQVSSVNNQVQAQTSVSNAAEQNLQAVTGVDPNEQLVSLLNFQQSYQAAAKVISTADTAVQSLLAAV